MIIDTCPKCGNVLVNEVICTIPPIPAKRCYACGWYWEGKDEEVEYRKFEVKEWDSTME